MKKSSLIASDSRARVKLNIGLALCMTLIYAIYCFVLVPLTISLSVNVMYSDTLLPTVLEIIYDAAELLAMCIGYAASIYAIYAFGVREAIPSMIIFCALTLFKYISNIVMDMANGNLDFEVLFSEELWALILPVVLELIQYFVVVIIAKKVISAHKKIISNRNKSLVALGREVPQGDGIYPFSNGIFDKKNPMVRMTFWVSMVVLITSSVQAVPYFLILSYIQGFNILQVLSYLAEVCVRFALSYVAVIFILKLLLSKRNKRQQQNK